MNVHWLTTLSRYALGAMLCIAAQNTVWAQDCSEIFPGAAQNSNNSGAVILRNNSRLINTPNNQVITTDFVDNAGPGNSCNGVSCTQVNSIVPASDRNGYPNNNGDINLGFNQTATVFPGEYGSLWLNSSATLIMQPGVYTIRNNFQMLSDSEIQVAGAGSVTIFVRETVSLNNAAQINVGNPDGYVFLFSRQSITFGSATTVNAVVYARQNFTMQNGGVVTGAVTSRFDLTLNSALTIIYDADAIDNTNYDGFCTQYIPPNLIAEWRLDELTWSGAADEVLDSSGNNLHGNARDPYGATVDLPQTSLTNPAIVGDPGTCRYGDFNGGADGFVQIDDPGTGSILDVTEFSVTSWIYPRRWATGGLMTIVSKDENFEYHLNNGGQVNWWWGGGSRELTTAASVPINGWHHIAITYESGNQVIYVDGAVAASGNDTNGITLNNDPVLIGVDLAFQSRLFDGYIDEVRIYDGPLSQADVNSVMMATHPCIPENLLDHFAIDVSPGNASTCVPAEVTITAEDDSDNTLLDYVGEITISTSTNNGNWASTDALGVLAPGAADSGNADYEFETSEADQGSIRLSLANSHAETLTITVTDNDAGVTSTSANLTFSENAFVVNVVDTLGNDVIAGRDHAFQVQMIRNDPTTGSCGPADEYDVSDVKLWINRDASDPSGAAPAAITASETQSLPDTEPAANNLTLPFVDGEANFTLQTSDVGRYSLQFKDDSSGFSDVDILGGSGALVARPFGFDIQIAGNPAATSAAGPVFTEAGADFSAAVRAVLYDAADDSNGDGIADGHADADPTTRADLSNNGVTPSFGNEPVVPGEARGVRLSATLQLPLGGNDPGLATSDPADGRELPNFTAGIATTSTINFAEVGIIEIEARLASGDYLNAGAAIGNRIQGRSGFVGRFIPNHFVVVPTSITPACAAGAFSYMAQPFTVNYAVDARNSEDQLTQNYTGDFARFDLTTGLGSLSYGAIDTGTPLSSRLNSTTVLPWLNGSAAAVGTITLVRDSAPDGPFANFTLGVTLQDGDSVSLRTADLDLDVDGDTSLDNVDLGSHTQRFGRVRLADAFGPETANLPVTFVTEYWDGTVWVQNSDDQCSTISLDQINYAGVAASTSRTVAVGSASTTGNYTDLTGGNVNFNAGDAGHFFTAPGAGNTGSFQVDVNLINYPWLRFDWNNDGDYGDTALPSATYTFGSYRGHDRIIFWREVY